MAARSNQPRIIRFISSLELTVICLSLLMVLVVACTLAQVELGTSGAVDRFMRSYLVWWHPSGGAFKVPVLPGGALVGMFLTLNLVASLTVNLNPSWKKAGIYLIHLGLILLVAGEFVTALVQVDARMNIEVGQTVNYVERPGEYEVAVIDTTNPATDEVYSVPRSLLMAGGTIPLEGTPLSLRVEKYFANSEVRNRTGNDPASPANQGAGPNLAITEHPPVTSDEERDSPAAYIEMLADGKSVGMWLLSAQLDGQPLTHAGHAYSLQMRPRREYLPYALTLKKFSHDVYPGTEIPKNFSSLVQLNNKETGESREVLIFMNQPLRYLGRTFYQASFGKNDTLSVLQVVENPGWLLPYISCVLVTLGLFVHFGITLRRAQSKRSGQTNAEAQS